MVSRTNFYAYASNDVDLIHAYGFGGGLDLEESYFYNTNHQVIAFTNAADEKATAEYLGPARKISKITTTAGLNVFFRYHPTNNLALHDAGFLREVEEAEISRTNSFGYTNGLVHVRTNELGLATSYTWDGLERLRGISYPDSSVSLVYHKLDLVGVQDRLNHWTRYQYDSMQRLIATTNANDKISRFGRCSCGALESVTNEVQEVTRFSYDNQLRRTSVQFHDASSIHYHYDSAGRMTNIVDGLDRGVGLFYNNQGLVARATTATGQVFRALYDRENRAVEITDSAGITRTNHFDKLDRVKQRHWPDQGVEQWIYSKRGLAQHINPLNQTNLFFYDPAGRLVTHTNGNQEVMSFEYNQADAMTKLLNGKNQSVRWEYDVEGRVRRKIDALNRDVFTNGYDVEGRVFNRWTARGITTYGYDPMGNLQTIDYPTSPDLTFTYDNANRLKDMEDPVMGKTTFTYTGSGQLKSEASSWAASTVTYSYVERQRSQLSLAQPSGPDWTQGYSYDGARRLEQVSTAAGNFGYQFKGATSLVGAIRFPGNAYVTNVFDPMGQIERTALNNQWHQPIDFHNYAYDQWSRRTNSVRLTGSKIHYTYDRDDQLVGAFGSESNGAVRLHEQFGYAYDAAHNLQRRTNNAFLQSFVVDNSDQLSSVIRTGTFTSSGSTEAPAAAVSVNSTTAELYQDQSYAAPGLTLVNGQNSFSVSAQNLYGSPASKVVQINLPEQVAYQYDAQGNLTSDGLRVFDYDDESRLTSITVANQRRSEFVYDGLSRRRIRREYSWTGSSWGSPTEEVRYVYDGHLVSRSGHS